MRRRILVRAGLKSGDAGPHSRRICNPVYSLFLIAIESRCAIFTVLRPPVTFYDYD
jgi:hypothetical protein